MRIDLHTHSKISDGTEEPADVIRAAADAGLDVVALTDHDTTGGWEQAAAAARRIGIGFVPGMEISCRTVEGISVHVLSYLHDPQYPDLLAEISKARDARLTRAERMVELLAEDFPITWEDVHAHVGHGATVGRPHIADALVAAGVVADRTEAFANILTSHSRYYVTHYAPDPVLAVELVRQAGGVPVFAHPVASARGRVVAEDVFRQMVDAGLAGVEADHRDNPPEGQAWLRRFAIENGLFLTGSSDYHGTGKPNRLGENVTAEEVLYRILDEGSGAEAFLPGHTTAS
ncbi:PHP domain-containing protein [Arthrobacter mobilis]|uniref:PHP domain-containing protein n=1 Tax=Arthrobacter mobilis TaxID=2724944 RepID=A0A7X6K308_9MICC|nr:PHP domain-containing protein [Arthrobacter mobilis]NKX53767.1 PHP domain-containing protein [Arthrobacter mobilis]